eukprot:2566586-Pleurochrysis_carterae.AAC.1
MSSPFALARRCLANRSGWRLTGPQLTDQIKAAENAQDLFATHSQHRAECDHIAISALWIQLSKLTRGKKVPVPKAQL